MDLTALILDHPEMDALRAKKDLDGLAAAVNDLGLTMTASPCMVSARYIVAKCPSGREIYAALKAAAIADDAVEVAVVFLRQPAGIDIGDEDGQRMIEELVPNVLSQAWADQIKALAEVPLVVDRLQIAAAMFDDFGNQK